MGNRHDDDLDDDLGDDDELEDELEDDDQADDDEDLDDDELDEDLDDDENQRTIDALADKVVERDAEVKTLREERDALKAELKALKEPAEKDDRLHVKRSQLRDKAWMRENQAAYAKAVKAGKVNIID